MTSTNSHLRFLLSTIAVVVIVGVGFYAKTFRYGLKQENTPLPRGSVRDTESLFDSTTLTLRAQEKDKDVAEAGEQYGDRAVTERAAGVQKLLAFSGTLVPSRAGARVTLPHASSTRSHTTTVTGQMLPKGRAFHVDELNSTDVRRIISIFWGMKRKGTIGDFAGEGKVLIYNKVGKCGSRSLVWLLTSLAEKNRLALVGSVYGSKVHPRAAGISAITNLVRQLPPGSVYHRHVHFFRINRPSSSSPRLLYFNMLRHPFERAVSSYYFHRFGDNMKAGIRGNYERDTGNETFDECVQHRRYECTSERSLWYVVPYFCGQLKTCRKPSRWALVRAKQHIAKEFLFVGLVEYFNETIQAMEKLLPEMFAGARESWAKKTSTRSPAEFTRTRKKKAPLASNRRFVLSRMKLELEFYAFVKKNFFSTLQRLGIAVTSLGQK